MLLEHFVELFLASAPWLLLGLFIAGLIQVFVPTDMMSRHLGEEGIGSATKAAFIGAPLPLCSCGVIPAGLGLRKAGASRSATTSFLVATPETGVDSVSLSYALLGPFMAIVRPITAIVSAIVAGVLVGKENTTELSQSEKSQSVKNQSEKKPAEKSKLESGGDTGCCGTNKTAVAKPVSEPAKEASCCASKQSNQEHSHSHSHSHSHDTHANQTQDIESISAKLRSAFKYSTQNMIADTATWLLVGLFFAALIQTFVPGDFLAKWGSGLLAMTVMVLVSIPMYICATASTPIAAGLLLSGVSPGAVLVFMMAGPATNIATLGVVAKALGRRAVVAYLVGVIGTAFVAGWLTDYLVGTYGFNVAPMVGHEHQLLPDWLVVGSSIVLALLMIRSYIAKLPINKLMGRDA